MILTDEFSRQASMEQDLGIPSALFAAPVREIVELGKSQIGFMNMFAIPLFQGVTDVMPAMEFTVEELHRNKTAWEKRIEEEQAKTRQHSADSAMDGRLSPRMMSLATPSDGSHQKTSNVAQATARSGSDSESRIKAMLEKSPFSPSNGGFDKSMECEHDGSSPGLSTSSPTDSNPSPSEVTHNQSSQNSLKPDQLHLISQTASAPGRLDQPGTDADLPPDGDDQINGVDLKLSLATDHVRADGARRGRTDCKQRSSDTTEGSNSAAGDSTWHATSAATSKTPISPSTQGTSIMSEDSVEKYNTPTGTSPLASHASPMTGSTVSTPGEHGPEDSYVRHEPHEGKGVLMETVRHLRKKPSRFRMNGLNFWKRSKSASPPMPGETRPDKQVVGGEDEGGQWGTRRQCS